VKIVVKVGAGADDEIHQPSFHQLDHCTRQARRRVKGSGNCQGNGRVVLGRSILS
jgi:hypothetical protein